MQKYNGDSVARYIGDSVARCSCGCRKNSQKVARSTFKTPPREEERVGSSDMMLLTEESRGVSRGVAILEGMSVAVARSCGDVVDAAVE